LSNEQDLDDIKLNYKVLSKQIYSLHKNFIQDFELFYGADLENSSNNKRKANFKVECNDLHRTSEVPHTVVSSNEKSRTTSTFVSKKQEPKQIEKSIIEEPKNEIVKVSSEKKTIGIASMFANQKPVSKKPEESVVATPKEEKMDKSSIQKKRNNEKV
jgi:hypothetical protein